MVVDGLQKGLFSKIIAKKRKLSGCGCVGKDLLSKIIGKNETFLALDVLEKDLLSKIIGKIESFWRWGCWKRMSFPRSLPNTKVSGREKVAKGG